MSLMRRNEKRRIAHLSFADKRDGVYSFQEFPELRKMPMGTIIHGWFDGDAESAIRIKPVDEEVEIDRFMVKVSGKIRRKEDKPFGFLSGKKDAFVAPEIISEHNLVQGQPATMLCVYAKKPDGLSSGWRAVKVYEVGEAPKQEPKPEKKPEKKAETKADKPQDESEVKPAQPEPAKENAPMQAAPVAAAPLPIAEEPVQTEAALPEVKTEEVAPAPAEPTPEEPSPPPAAS